MKKIDKKHPSKSITKSTVLYFPLFPFCFFRFFISLLVLNSMKIDWKILYQKWPLHRGIRRASRSPPPRTSDESSNSVSSSAMKQVWADRFQTTNRNTETKLQPSSRFRINDKNIKHSISKFIFIHKIECSLHFIHAQYVHTDTSSASYAHDIWVVVWKGFHLDFF